MENNYPSYGIVIDTEATRVFDAFPAAPPYLENEAATLDVDDEQRADVEEAIKTVRDLLLRIETDGRESLYD